MRRLPHPGVLALAMLLVATSAAHAADSDVRRASETLKTYAKEPFEQDKRADALRALARIGGKDAAEAVLPVFGDPFVHLADRGVSAWIAMVKGDRAAETTGWLASKGLKHRRTDVRAGAATALGFGRLPEAGEALSARASKEKDPDVLVSLYRAWARTEARAPSRFVDHLRHKDGRVVLAAVEALRRREMLDAIPPGNFEEMLRHKHPQARAAGVLAHLFGNRFALAWAEQVLADRDETPRIALAEGLDAEVEGVPWDPVARELLRSLLADGSWRVRARAIESVLSQWRADGVPLLIDRLEQERGRLRLDLSDALTAITGKTLGADPDLWRAWWQANKDTFDPGSRPKGRRPRTPDAKQAGETKTTTFFRLPVMSGRVAFLLDCSGSMRDPAIGDDAGGISKMDLARKELARTLSGLADDVRFDVFLYRYPSDYPPQPEMTRAFKRLEPGTEASAKKAEAWLAGQPVKGWGAFSDALEHLIALDVDTIFFLSDGRPSRGRFDRDFRLIAELERTNRFRQVVVHTVLVGDKRADRAFLEELAEITGGHFTDATRR